MVMPIRTLVKLSFESSPPERPQSAKEKSMKKEHSNLKGKIIGALRGFRNGKDSAIDTSDAPEVLGWGHVRRGVLYRPLKQQITLRLDADVIEWFKEQAEGNETGYQTAINAVLREHALRGLGESRIQPFPSMIDPKWLPENRLREVGPLVPLGDSIAWSNIPIREAVEVLRDSGYLELEAEATAYDDRVRARVKGGPCVCGCGDIPSGKRRHFAIGHDSKLRKRLHELWMATN